MYRACWLLSYLFAYGNGCLVLPVWGHSEWRNRERLSRRNHPPPKLSNSDFSDGGPSRPPTCNYVNDHHLVFPSVLMSGSRKIVYFHRPRLLCSSLIFAAGTANSWTADTFIILSWLPSSSGPYFCKFCVTIRQNFKSFWGSEIVNKKKIPLRGGSSALMNSFIRKMLIEVEAKWKMLRYSEAKTC